MRKAILIISLCLAYVFLCVGFELGEWCQAKPPRYEMKLTPQAKQALIESYAEITDPNDPIYTGLVKLPDTWKDKYGDSDRSRLMFNITTLIQVVINQGERIKILEEKLLPKDPNEPLR